MNRLLWRGWAERGLEGVLAIALIFLFVAIGLGLAVPPVLVVMLWPSDGSPTIAEVIHDAEGRP